ncbi:MAG: gliding motility-associated C-terminal domain-containing protein [Saprospiraceae bacterium]
MCGTINSNIVHVTFKDCNCYFYKCIFPNYDGINDEFSPFSDCEVLRYKLNIFNRWGDFVFESTDVRLGWDGTFRGESANIGVYTYFIEATLFRNGVQEKINMEGDVTLIR